MRYVFFSGTVHIETYFSLKLTKVCVRRKLLAATDDQFSNCLTSVQCRILIRAKLISCVPDKRNDQFYDIDVKRPDAKIIGSVSYQRYVILRLHDRANIEQLYMLAGRASSSSQFIL